MVITPDSRKHWSGYRRCVVPAAEVAPRYDAVVIGAGIGGLVCAALLASNGCKVLLVERHKIPGGLCSFFKRKGFYFDAGAHYFGALGQPKSFVGLLLRQLKLELSFIPQDPVEILHFPDQVLELPANYFDYLEQLRRLFPEESEAITLFFDELLRVYRHQYRGQESELLVRYRGSTFQDRLDRFFSSPRLKGILGSSVGFVGVRPGEVSAAAMAAVIMSYHYEGGYLAEGGSQSLPDSLMWRLKDLGAHLLLDTLVSGLIVENGRRVAGVELASGQKVQAGIVISNADARHTFLHLIGEKYLDRDYRETLRSSRESNSLKVLYLGLKCDAGLLHGMRGWYFASDALNDPANGFRYIATPTLEDPSLAPPGHHILTVSSACTEPVEQDGEMYTEEWSRHREDYEAETLAWLGGIIPGILERVVTQDTATRRTFHHYTANSRGAVYGWDCGPGQFGRDRLGIETPFENMFLCGHWAEPGPGVASVAISGALAARRAMKSMEGARAPIMAGQG